MARVEVDRNAVHCLHAVVPLISIEVLLKYFSIFKLSHLSSLISQQRLTKHSILGVDLLKSSPRVARAGLYAFSKTWYCIVLYSQRRFYWIKKVACSSPLSCMFFTVAAGTASRWHGHRLVGSTWSPENPDFIPFGQMSRVFSIEEKVDSILAEVTTREKRS